MGYLADMKYEIRTRSGEVMTVPDGSFLFMLVRQNFVDPDDEIRREGHTKWRRVRDIPEFSSMLAHRSGTRRFHTAFYLVLFIGLLAMVIAIWCSSPRWGR